MNEKRRRTVSLDAWIDERLAEEDSASAVLNRLADGYYNGGLAEEVAARFRLRKIDADIQLKKAERDHIDARLDALRAEREAIEASLNAEDPQVTEAVEAYAEHVESNVDPQRALEPDHPGLKNWAAKAGMQPNQFADRVRAELNGALSD